MELLLIRHGLPEKVIKESGPADPPLDAAGLRQADLLASYLEAEAIDAIWTSPMQRARQTAAPLAASKGLEVNVHDGIAEWDRNSPEYIPIEELKVVDPEGWKAMMAGEWRGELDPISFTKLVVESIEEIINAHPRQRVAVTCHGGVINAYIAHILEVPKHAFYQPDYTSIHRVMAASSGVRSVRTLNEIAHLRGTGLLSDRP
jgi:2,3-bisphosphoglycerate-dependent phosphoglycerate mutase